MGIFEVMLVALKVDHMESTLMIVTRCNQPANKAHREGI